MSRIAKLPAGYRQVECIESSGTQYVDTGFMPNGNTRVVCDFQITKAFDISRAIFGARTSGTSQLFVLFHIGSNSFRNDYYGNIQTMSVTNDLARMIVDKNKNVTTLDGKTQTYTAVTTATTCSMFLFAAHNVNKADNLAYVKIYACQIYDNGNLVREYVPCINPSGEAGLYDLVYGVFYGNAGTGVFAVGPYLEVDTPADFEQILAVYLRWGAVDCEAYKIYRNGSLIGTTTDTHYIDLNAEQNETYIYTLIAYRGATESEPTELTVYTRSGYFVIKPLIENAFFQ